MLRTKALRKIFIATLALFILLTIYLIPTTEKEKVLKTNLEIEEVTGLGTNSIYLLNTDGYLVKTKILLDSSDKCEQTKTILENLIIKDGSKFPNGLKALIPENTKVLNVIYAKKIMTVDFSKEFKNVTIDKEKAMLSSIVYSIIDLKDIEGVRILVEGEVLEEYPNTHEKLDSILDKSIGINKKYDLTSRKDISKVVIYFLDKIDENIYYVPVTKYVNDNRDKIKIIVEELSTSSIYEANLMSFLNSNIKLLDYEEKENVLFLNFNKYLFDKKEKIVEEVLYTIAYSVFDNYDVNMVFFEVNGKKVGEVSKSKLP